jgi:hypothetical protein
MNPDELFAGPMAFSGQQPAQQTGMAASSHTYQEGQTAINRQNGQRIVFRGGKWVPM